MRVPLELNGTRALVKLRGRRLQVVPTNTTYMMYDVDADAFRHHSRQPGHFTSGSGPAYS